MVNLGLNLSSLLGIILAVAGAGLYFLRTWKPKLARDHDIFFAAVGLLCGGILLFQGWRLDPILAFGQFLLSGTAIFFASESISLRGATTAQAKNRSQYVEEDRPVSRSYTYESYDAELEQLEPEEEYPPNRRLRGNQEPSSARDTYDEEPRRRPSSRNGTAYRPESSEKPRRRPPRPDRSPEERPGSWDTPTDLEENPPRSRNSRPSSEPRNSDSSSRPKRRPSEESRSRRSNRDPDVTPADYVEYRPMNDPDEESDRSSNLE